MGSLLLKSVVGTRTSDTLHVLWFSSEPRQLSRLSEVDDDIYEEVKRLKAALVESQQETQNVTDQINCLILLVKKWVKAPTTLCDHKLTGLKQWVVDGALGLDSEDPGSFSSQGTTMCSGLEISSIIRYLLPLFVRFYGTKMLTISSWRFSNEISTSYNQNTFETLILSITGSIAFNGYKVC